MFIFICTENDITYKVVSNDWLLLGLLTQDITTGTSPKPYPRKPVVFMFIMAYKYRKLHKDVSKDLFLSCDYINTKTQILYIDL